MPIIALVLKIIIWGGEHFWFYVWAFIFSVSLVLLWIYPTWIAPLFNKFTPLEEGPLRTAIEELAKKVGFPLTKIFVVDGSTRSAHSNAYFYGFFKNKRIVIYDTLIKQVDQEGIVAILGHELGHYKLSHNLKNLVISQFHILMFLYLFSLTLHTKELYRSFGFDTQPV
jgi:STE24 endopeptidase